MRLWLLRHAKSSWADTGLDDRDRPLAPRGVRAAALMREFIEGEGIRPDLVLCSSALRTRQTLAEILPALGPKVEILIDGSIYASEADQLLDRIRDVPSAVGSLMVIGHNPAIQELATMLTARGGRREAIRVKFPTGAIAEISFPGASCGALTEGSGELTRFVTPRDLEAA